MDTMWIGAVQMVKYGWLQKRCGQYEWGKDIRYIMYGYSKDRVHYGWLDGQVQKAWVHNGWVKYGCGQYG